MPAHPEAGAFNVTTASSGGRPKTKQRSAKKKQILYHQHTKDHVELPARGPASVTLLSVDRWDPAEPIKQVNSCLYVCFPETKNTHTHCRCRTSETWGAGICAGMCSAAAGGTQTCCLPWSIVPALLQPHTNHPAVTTGLLALTPADLPHSFPNGTKRSNNFPSLEKIPLVPNH